MVSIDDVVPTSSDSPQQSLMFPGYDVPRDTFNKDVINKSARPDNLPPVSPLPSNAARPPCSPTIIVSPPEEDLETGGVQVFNPHLKDDCHDDTATSGRGSLLLAAAVALIVLLTVLFIIVLSAILDDYYQLLSNSPTKNLYMPPSGSDIDIQEAHPVDPIPDNKLSGKHKKQNAKFVPWEPFKAAPSADRKGEIPNDVDDRKLVPYRMSKSDSTEEITTVIPMRQLVDERKKRLETTRIEDNERIRVLEGELEKVREQVIVEHELNKELKRLLLAAVNEDLELHLSGLAEDKVRLANSLTKYANKLKVDDEQLEEVQIERDVYKSKFLAMATRADEQKRKAETVLYMLRRGQNLMGRLLSTGTVPDSMTSEVSAFYQTDLLPYYERSPCEERVQRPSPVFHNLTISCCKNCSGKDIQVL